MKLLFTFLFILNFTAIYAQENSKVTSPPGTHYYTIAAGTYNNTTTVWSLTGYAGAPCSCAPPCNLPANTFVHINKLITATCNPLDIGSNATFDLAAGGTFSLTGPATITGTGSLSIAAGSTLHVQGNLTFSGSGDGTINGALIVTGVTTMPNTGGSIVCGTGSMTTGTLVGSPTLPCGAGLIIKVLPIELIDFTATCETNGVKLNWSTASEKGNDHFILEKSNDGFNWQTVTEIKGGGTTHELKNYVHIDYKTNDGIYYYKLTQVDVDGKSESFKPIDINCENKAKDELILFPNPATTELNIILNVNKPTSNGYIKLTDNLGKIIFDLKLDLQQGVNTFNYPLDAKDGSYNVIFTADNLVIPNQKLLIVNP